MPRPTAHMGLWLLLLAACTDPSTNDADGDGVSAARDCDDNDPDVGAAAEFELCNGLDDDCNGRIDDMPVDGTPWYRDVDGDGFGAPDTRAPRLCEAPEPTGWSADNTDCDDGFDTVFPGADERCDGLDNDCDDTIDEDPIDPQTFYADKDEDTWGDPDDTVQACTPPDGYVGRPGDCDDFSDLINLAADEVCNQIDDDCDGDVDEDALNPSTWWRDGDADGFGTDTGESVLSCSAPEGFSGEIGDCDDAEPRRFPGNPEICDGLDNDCDEGTTDEGTLALDGAAISDFEAALASATDGSTLAVCAGTWPVNLDISVDLTLEGPDGATDTILTPADDGAILVVGEGASLTVSNLSLQDGVGTLGGAIDASKADSLTLREAVLTSNLAEHGGAIFVGEAGTLTMTDCTLSDNVAIGDGGAVHAGTTTLERTTFDGNAAERGGGLAVKGGDVTMDIDTRFVNNLAGEAGGGIAVLGAHQISDGELDGNSSEGDGGGIWLADGAAALICNVHDNSADGRGGGLACVGDCRAESLFLTDNLATHGAGLAAIGTGAMDVTATQISGNVATGDGGGVLVDDSGASVTITGGLVLDNAATAGGGASVPLGELVSDAVDWGTGSLDNDPDDVDVVGETYDAYGTSATFTCDASAGTCE